MLLGIIILLACAYFANKAIRDARSRAWTGPRTPQMRTRAKTPRPPSPGRGRTALRSAGAAVAHPSNGGIRAQARADAQRLWTEAAVTNWLEQQRHHRQNGTATPAAAPAPRAPLRQRLRLAPAAVTRPAPAGGGATSAPPQQANGTRPAAPGNGGPPARQAPAPPAPAQPTSNGGTVAGSTAGAEQLIDGIGQIHATAQAGGIHAKHAAVKAATEGCLRFANMLQMLSRQMSEPGQHYGPEITEPIGNSATHLQAAAMTLAQADTNIATLINTTLGELAKGARQAPHHDELNEAGAH